MRYRNLQVQLGVKAYHTATETDTSTSELPTVSTSTNTRKIKANVEYQHSNKQFLPGTSHSESFRKSNTQYLTASHYINISLRIQTPTSKIPRLIAKLPTKAQFQSSKSLSRTFNWPGDPRNIALLANKIVAVWCSLGELGSGERGGRGEK